MNLHKFFLRLVVLSSLIYLAIASHVTAAPFVGINDKQLHADLHILSEWGYLDATVTTYPVPWKGISNQIEALELAALPYMPQQAALRLKHYLKAAKSQKSKSFAELQASSEAPRLTSFDGPNYDQASIRLKHQLLTDQWYVQGAIAIDKDGDINFDQSMVAYQFENWQIRVGAIDQYWGPSLSSSLILTNNAKPLPAIAFSRGSTAASSSKWLSWLGSWHYTGQIAQLASDRVIPNAKLVLNRFTFSPFKRFEIGASWAVMWGGDTQPEGFSEFFDVITLQKTCLQEDGICTDAEFTKQGNHLAGFDIKYSFMLLNRPITIYGQRIGEDAASSIQITDNANLIGLSTYVGNAKVFVETSDTNIACASAESTITNCYYEHGTYQTGYRHKGRAIGSSFDSDAKQITIGTNYRFKDGAIAELLLTKAELNPDGVRPSPVLDGSASEDLLQLRGFYQRPFGAWLVKAGGWLESRDLDNQTSKTQAALYLNTTYSF